MESDDLRQLQRTAERGEAAPWVDFPPTPAWYPPATGLWVAAMTATLAELGGPLGAVALVVLLAAEAGFLVWYRRYRGTMPSGAMPAEMRRAAIVLGASMVALAGVLVVLCQLLATWVPVVVALVATTSLIAWYERAYAAGAAGVRARLA